MLKSSFTSVHRESADPKSSLDAKQAHLQVQCVTKVVEADGFIGMTRPTKYPWICVLHQESRLEQTGIKKLQVE